MQFKGTPPKQGIIIKRRLCTKVNHLCTHLASSNVLLKKHAFLFALHAMVYVPMYEVVHIVTLDWSLRPVRSNLAWV
jgi:hypothetical protein